MSNYSELKLRPRKYQIKASEIALSNKKTVIVMPTGTGKTLIGLMWAKSLLDKKKARKILVLEPTRILVEQVSAFYKKVSGLDTGAIHSMMPEESKRRGWLSRIVVTTPEEILFNMDKLDSFDAIVIDECHHSVGEDAYKKVLEASTAEWRLGLSAHIPKRHRKSIEKLIGRIYEWSTSDPDISRYIPDWIGEVYECPLDNASFKVYKLLEKEWLNSDRREKILYGLALRFLSRDGALALKESLSKKTKLASLLSKYKQDILRLPDLHKLDKLNKAIDQHDFEKAIIFVDRVIVARKLKELFQGYDTVVITGKRRNGDRVIKQALELARRKETRIVISTSAGEEGVDLPSADLLVLWSNVVSPLRFIQRHGRILRKTKPVKFVVYLVTPNTIDMNAFLDSVYLAKKVGVDINISNESLRDYLMRSPRAILLSALENPLPREFIQEVTGLGASEVQRALRLFFEQGELFYVYTPLGRTIAKPEHIPILYEKYPEYFNPENIQGKVVIILDSRKKVFQGDYKSIINTLTKFLGRFNGLRITLRENIDSIEYVYSLSYNFRIKEREVLEIVLKNAFTKTVFTEYG